jgi:hypothetical protein
MNDGLFLRLKKPPENDGFLFILSGRLTLLGAAFSTQNKV